MAHALIIHPKDNVAVVTTAVSKGSMVECAEDGKILYQIVAAEDIPVYHKIALESIPENAEVKKYGCVIGLATSPIPQGTHVHCHNVISRSLKEEA